MAPALPLCDADAQSQILLEGPVFWDWNEQASQLWIQGSMTWLRPMGAVDAKVIVTQRAECSRLRM